MQSHIWFKNMVLDLRRWCIWIVAIVALGAGVYFGGPALVPETRVQAQIDEQIGRWTGGAIRLRADAKITVGPGFRVVVSNSAFVSVSDEDLGPVVTADTIVAPLKIFPLLFGRVEIAELMLLRPDIDLRVPSGHFATLAQPAVPGDTLTGETGPLGDVVLVDGTLRFRGAGDRKKISDLNLRLGADGATDAVAIRGRVFVGMRHLRVDLQVDDVRAFVSDVGSHAMLNVRLGPRHESDPSDVASSTYGMPYEIIDQVRQAAYTLGLPWSGVGSMAAEGTFSITPEVITVSDATVSLGGVEMKGHMRAKTAGRSVIAQLLGLPGAVSGLLANAKDMDGRRWVDVPVTLDWLEGLDLDIGLVREALPNGNPTRDTAAVSLAVRNGSSSFDLAGNIEGLGHMQATLALEQEASEQVRVRASGRVDTMSVGKITQFLATMGPPPLIGTAQLPEGTMKGDFDINAKGHTFGQLVDSLNGSVTAQLKGGSLVGADVVATLETLVRGREFMTEKHGPLIPAAGRTEFDQLDARIDLASGTANLSRVYIVGERFGIDMLGEVQLTEGTMNIGGNAVLLSSPATGPQSVNTLVDLPFGVGGTVFGLVVAAGVPKVSLAQVEPDADSR